MSRRLLLVGAILTLATATIWLGGAVDWMQSSVGDVWSGWTLKGALVAFGAALALRLLSPVAGVVTTGRCSVCGRRTKAGHKYCLDHLQETVNQTRDLTREELPPRPRVQAQHRS